MEQVNSHRLQTFYSPTHGKRDPFFLERMMCAIEFFRVLTGKFHRKLILPKQMSTGFPFPENFKLGQ